MSSADTTSRTGRSLTSPALLAVVVAAADLVSKFCVERWAAVRRLPFVYLIENPSYTMGAGGIGGWYLPVLSAIMIAVALWWLAPVLRAGCMRSQPAGLAIGGAVGNLVDRMIHGQVTDFLATPWLVVNFADVAVLAGFSALVVSGDWRHLTPAARRTMVLAQRPGRAADPAATHHRSA